MLLLVAQILSITSIAVGFIGSTMFIVRAIQQRRRGRNKQFIGNGVMAVGALAMPVGFGGGFLLAEPFSFLSIGLLVLGVVGVVLFLTGLGVGGQ